MSGAVAEADPTGATGGVASGVAAAIDALLAVDPDVLGDGELGEVLVELHRQQARLAGGSARLVGVFDARRAWADDGSRGCGAWNRPPVPGALG